MGAPPLEFYIHFNGPTNEHKKACATRCMRQCKTDGVYGGDGGIQKAMFPVCLNIGASVISLRSTVSQVFFSYHYNQARTQDFAQEGATCSRRGPQVTRGPLGDLGPPGDQGSHATSPPATRGPLGDQGPRKLVALG